MDEFLEADPDYIPAYVDVVHDFFDDPENEVLRLDDLISKTKPGQLDVVLNCLEDETSQANIQVAFLQGAPFYKDEHFPRLEKFLKSGSVWSVNLGEIPFQGHQLDHLCTYLKDTNVTHMFMELEGTHNAHWKNSLRDSIRDNRAKHDRYIYKTTDVTQNDIIKAAVKNWFSPSSHGVNQRFVEKYGGHRGIEDRERIKVLRQERYIPWLTDRVRFQTEAEGPFVRGSITQVISQLFTLHTLTTYTSMSLYTYMHIHNHIHIHIHIHKHIRIHMHIHRHIRMHRHMHIHMHIYIYVNTSA
jgi:hypothetical protein